MKRISFHIAEVITLVMTLFLSMGCETKDGFLRSAVTEFFTQDYNPYFIDVLWVVDDRSTLSSKPAMRSALISQAANFFTRLDGMAAIDYRMAFISGDTELSIPGALKPKNNPVILFKNYGSVNARANNFANIFAQNLNLHTGANLNVFESARQALKTTFQPRAGVPMVLVFISDSEDVSPFASNRVDYFSSEYLSLVGNKNDMLRVYSNNYTKNGDRCATVYNADIDQTDATRFEDQANYLSNFHRLATKLNGSNGDLCQSWSSTIDLQGLQLKQLPKTFQLKGRFLANSLIVSVFDKFQTYDIKYTYDAVLNQITFDTVPPQGSTIQVTYHGD